MEKWERMLRHSTKRSSFKDGAKVDKLSDCQFLPKKSDPWIQLFLTEAACIIALLSQKLQFIKNIQMNRPSCVKFLVWSISFSLFMPLNFSVLYVWI